MAIRQPKARREALPSLEAGDHLTREEFERRYEQRPDIRKAELVQGVVYVPSPVRIPEHGEPVGLLAAWLSYFAIQHPGIRAAVDGTTRLSAEDNVQPDAMLWREGGQAALDSDSYLSGAPELVVEVAASSASYDLHVKKDSYRRAGVQEYVVWRTLDGAIDWFRLRDGEYVLLEPDAEGVTHSEVFEGLRLDIPRLLAGDRSAILP